MGIKSQVALSLIRSRGKKTKKESRWQKKERQKKEEEAREAKKEVKKYRFKAEKDAAEIKKLQTYKSKTESIEQVSRALNISLDTVDAINKIVTNVESKAKKKAGLTILKEEEINHKIYSNLSRSIPLEEMAKLKIGVIQQMIKAKTEKEFEQAFEGNYSKILKGWQIVNSKEARAVDTALRRNRNAVEEVYNSLTQSSAA